MMNKSKGVIEKIEKATEKEQKVQTNSEINKFRGVANKHNTIKGCKQATLHKHIELFLVLALAVGCIVDHSVHVNVKIITSKIIWCLFIAIVGRRGRGRGRVVIVLIALVIN